MLKQILGTKTQITVKFEKASLDININILNWMACPATFSVFISWLPLLIPCLITSSTLNNSLPTSTKLGVHILVSIRSDLTLDMECSKFRCIPKFNRNVHYCYKPTAIREICLQGSFIFPIQYILTLINMVIRNLG